MTQDYPCRLYLRGEVIPGDLHATNSVIVRDAEAEEDAREKGYRKAYEVEPAPVTGGNGGSPTASPPPDAATSDVSGTFHPIQGGAAATSADPPAEDAPADDAPPAKEPTKAELLAELKTLGQTPHHKMGVEKLKALLAEAKAGQ